MRPRARGIPAAQYIGLTAILGARVILLRRAAAIPDVHAPQIAFVETGVVPLRGPR